MGASLTCRVTPAWDVNGQLVGLIVTTGGTMSRLVLLFSHGHLVSFHLCIFQRRRASPRTPASPQVPETHLPQRWVFLQETSLQAQVPAWAKEALASLWERGLQGSAAGLSDLRVASAIWCQPVCTAARAEGQDGSVRLGASKPRRLHRDRQGPVQIVDGIGTRRGHPEMDTRAEQQRAPSCP